MKLKLLDLLACPVCKSEFTLVVVSKGEEEITEGELICSKGHSYPIKNSVPRLVKSDMSGEKQSGGQNEP